MSRRYSIITFYGGYIMKTISLKKLRMFLDDNGFDYINISSINTPGITVSYEDNWSDPDIKDISIISIDGSDYYRPYMVRHTVTCRINNSVDVVFEMSSKTIHFEMSSKVINFVHFIQRNFYFDKNFFVTDRDLNVAAKENDLEWITKLFSVTPNAGLLYMHKCIYEGKWDEYFKGTMDIEVKRLLMKELTMRNLSCEENLEL